MTVGKLRQKCSVRIHVRIMAARAPDRVLPEPTATPIREGLRPEFPMLAPDRAQSTLSVETHVLFESLQEPGDVHWIMLAWPVRIEQNMHVLRHDDIADQTDTKSHLQTPQRINHNLFHSVIMEECKATEARYRPEVDISWSVHSTKKRRHRVRLFFIAPPPPKEVGHFAARTFCLQPPPSCRTSKRLATVAHVFRRAARVAPCQKTARNDGPRL